MEPFRRRPLRGEGSNSRARPRRGAAHGDSALDGPTSWLGSLLCASLVVAAAAAPFAVRSAQQAGASGIFGDAPPRACGSLAAADPKRARRIRQRLGSVSRGRTLLSNAPRHVAICFRQSDETALTSDGVVRLDPRDGDGQSAARLGHLLLHLAQGLTRLDPAQHAGGCASFVAHTLRAEAAAHALELELRRDLHVPTDEQGFPFAADYWRAAPAHRVDVIFRYLQNHPDGTEQLPGFAGNAWRRCRALEGPSAPR